MPSIKLGTGLDIDQRPISRRKKETKGAGKGRRYLYWEGGVGEEGIKPSRKVPPPDEEHYKSKTQGERTHRNRQLSKPWANNLERQNKHEGMDRRKPARGDAPSTPETDESGYMPPKKAMNEHLDCSPPSPRMHQGYNGPCAHAPPIEPHDKAIFPMAPTSWGGTRGKVSQTIRGWNWSDNEATPGARDRTRWGAAERGHRGTGQREAHPEQDIYRRKYQGMGK